MNGKDPVNRFLARAAKNLADLPADVAEKIISDGDALLRAGVAVPDLHGVVVSQGPRHAAPTRLFSAAINSGSSPGTTGPEMNTCWSISAGGLSADFLALNPKKPA